MRHAPIRRGLRAVALALAIAVWAHARPAAAATDEERLQGRLPPDAAQQVLAIVRQARSQGLPGDPLVGRALEGASRHVDADGIVAEVRRNAVALAGARAALGSDSRADEITAGANALLAGVPPDSLARLRGAHPGGSVVIPLIVLCDFVARGVPVDAASGVVLAAARAGAGDEALLRMRERVNDRIQRGDPPAGSARDVVRRWLLSAPRAAPAPRSGAPAGGGTP